MKKYKFLTNIEISSFCGQLAMLLPAGITPLESIQLMKEDTVPSEGKNLLTQIETALINGKKFSEALSETNVFPVYVVSMVLLGEEAGKLDIIMAKLARFYEQQDNIAASVKGAVRYPLIMLGIMIIILIVLLAKVLPIFNQVFIQLGSGLTGISLRLMRIGGILQKTSCVFVCVLIFFAAAFFILLKNTGCRKRFTHFLHICYFTKIFFMDIAYGRFAGAMSMIISSGIDIFKGLELVKAVIENEPALKKLTVFHAALLDGDSVPEAIDKAGIFQAQHRKLLQISYKTGDSDRVFSSLSEYYEAAALNRVDRILAAIEPCLVIIFSLSVGIILMSVIMPLIGIMSNIG